MSSKPWLSCAARQGLCIGGLFRQMCGKNWTQRCIRYSTTLLRTESIKCFLPRRLSTSKLQTHSACKTFWKSARETWPCRLWGRLPSAIAKATLWASQIIKRSANCGIRKQRRPMVTPSLRVCWCSTGTLKCQPYSAPEWNLTGIPHTKVSS